MFVQRKPAAVGIHTLQLEFIWVLFRGSFHPGCVAALSVLMGGESDVVPVEKSDL